MQTYYNILETIKNQLKLDTNVNTVTTGDIFDVDLEKETIFPLSHVMVNQATRKDKVYTLNLSILLMDIVDKVSHEAEDVFKGNDNEQDVFNTQLAVGARLVEILKRGDLRDDNFELSSDPNFEPFTERFENSLAGWALTFDVDMPNDMTPCDNDIIPSDCAAASYIIVDEDGNTLYSGQIGSGLSNTEIISNSSVNNSDSSYTAGVLAEGSLILPNEDILVVNTDMDIIAQDLNRPSVKNGTIEVPDVNNVDSDGSIVPTPAGVAFTCTTASTQLYQAAKVNQTGQTVSYVTGDDITRGRLVDFFTLPYTNEWGHNKRLCGSTGGYADGSNYFDVNGNSTTRALAFPNDIVFDFSCRNVDSILSYYIGDIFTTRTQLVACPLYLSSTFGGLTGWNLWNDMEVRNVMCLHYMNTVTHWMNYKPFEFGASQRYFLTSSRVGSQVMRTDLRSVNFMATTNETNPLYTVYVRYTTLTELGF